MTVRELIQQLLTQDMDATVVVAATICDGHGDLVADDASGPAYEVRALDDFVTIHTDLQSDEVTQ